MNIIKDENGLIVNKAWPIEAVRAEAALAAERDNAGRSSGSGKGARHDGT